MNNLNNDSGIIEQLENNSFDLNKPTDFTNLVTQTASGEFQTVANIKQSQLVSDVNKRQNIYNFISQMSKDNFDPQQIESI